MCPGKLGHLHILTTKKGVMYLTFNKIRYDIELIFEQYRKHKYYTLFKTDVNVSVTSNIDRVGGGKSNKISDNVAKEAIKLVEEKAEAKRFVTLVEKAVEQLPDIEKELIQLRYMSNNHDYINDYTVYEVMIPMSAKTYRMIRERAFSKLFVMFSSLIQ